MRAKDQLLAAAAQSPVLQDVYVEGLSPAPQVELVVDREKAAALGVTFEEINNAISTNLGSAYINDFPNRGRMQRVIVQADRNARMQADQILTYNVRNTSGQLVPMSSFATVRWSVGPSRGFVGFNYYPSVRLSGSAKPGYISGDAIREMERLAARLPKGFGYEWAGQSLQEKLSGSQAPFLLMLSVLLVFLVLAALYESWTIPLSVLLTVPLGILGAVAAAMLRRAAERCLFHRRHRDHHRARRQGRHSDHRIRQSFARAGSLDQGGDYRSLPHALPSHRHDRPCVRLRRRAD